MGWLRWGWRQLTSMRTALVLLLLLAIAAVPGSIVPQRSADPNGVTQYFADNPDLAPVLDNLQLFDVYTSPWFSAIYILLFVSLIGCVIPRTKHHWKALRARPPRTPARLERLDATTATSIVELAPGRGCRRPPPTHRDRRRRGAAASAAATASSATTRAATLSVSAERGYLRETGNLVFHAALIGVLRRRRRRRRLHLHRPGRDHRGRHVRQHAARLHVVQPGPLRRRGARSRRTR